MSDLSKMIEAARSSTIQILQEAQDIAEGRVQLNFKSGDKVHYKDAGGYIVNHGRVAVHGKDHCVVKNPYGVQHTFGQDGKALAKYHEGFTLHQNPIDPASGKQMDQAQHEQHLAHQKVQDQAAVAKSRSQDALHARLHKAGSMSHEHVEALHKILDNYGA